MSYLRINLVLFSIFFHFSWNVQGQNPDLLIKAQKEVDTIMNNAISKRAFPGAVVYASLGDSVIVNKCYGFHTYDSLNIVEQEDLYDLASLTKVMGAGLAVMKLYENGLIDLDQPLRRYISGLRFRKVGRVPVRAFLAHQSGIESWIAFYKDIIKKDGSFNRYISTERTKKHQYEIGEGMFLSDDFDQKIKTYVKRASIDKEPVYRYSGLFFYLVPELVHNLSGMEYSEYLKEHFYEPIGSPSLTFNPTSKYSLDQIVPTEIDTFFRNSPIHGRVHDEGAILMGGVSGNAGLFGNVNDVAKIWKMLLNGGVYEGKQYLNPATIQLFTSYQYPQSGNRRGLIFDKPLLEYDSTISSVAESSSNLSFGHTGYTGTLVWADPKENLLFIFLSNRVYPDRNQKAIYELNVRPSIHQTLYDLLDSVKCEL
ncbi:MAG: serine hydrolase [Cyclobacteriaceae bacterium]